MSCVDCFFDRCADPEQSHRIFREIHPVSSTPPLPDRIEVFICSVVPKSCGPFLKQLPKLEYFLSHLKRVKRKNQRMMQKSAVVEPVSKKTKQDDELLVLVGLATDETAKVVQPLIDNYKLEMRRALLPGRPADSKDEQEIFNKIWPTIYFHKKTTEHKLSELELTADEIALMEIGMRESIQDGAAVIMDPTRKVIISRAIEELKLQGSQPMTTNPLVSGHILAIQGVSRRERHVALHKGMSSSDFQQGQYLCTGYDIFLLQEPSVFEAMALVHSRIRRVVFGVSNNDNGGLGGSGHYLHGLPGTNHHYRVFQCSEETDLWSCCNKKLAQMKIS